MILGSRRGRQARNSPNVLLFQPRVPGDVLSGIIRIQIDEATPDKTVADLEHVAPSAGAPLRIAGLPRPIGMLAMACALAHDQVTAREYPIELGEMVRDRRERSADIGEQLADLVSSSR